MRQRWHSLRGSFSIPNRIEPSATGIAAPIPKFCQALSVSPIGSSPLQLKMVCRLVRQITAFSIPNRIEPSATLAVWGHGQEHNLLSVSPIGSSPLQLRRRSPGAMWLPSLSVSPIGSSPLQQLAAGDPIIAIHTFSIPNRIEPSATLPSPVGWTTILRLSVSPIGSSPLQLVIIPSPSFLVGFFQYPQSDRALCNLGEAEQI